MRLVSWDSGSRVVKWDSWAEPHIDTECTLHFPDWRDPTEESEVTVRASGVGRQRMMTALIGDKVFASAKIGSHDVWVAEPWVNAGRDDSMMEMSRKARAALKAAGNG